MPDILNIITMTLPGVQVTYQGEEIAMTNNMDITWEETVDPSGCNCGIEHFKEEVCSRDPERTPMQWNDQPFSGFTTGNETWLPLNPDYQTRNVQTQAGEENSSLNIYKELTRLRQETPFKRGDVETVVVGDVFAFVRAEEGNPNEAFVTAANLGDSPVTVDLSQFSPTLNFGIVEVSTTLDVAG